MGVAGAGFLLWLGYNMVLLVLHGTVYGGQYGFRRWLRYEADGGAFVVHAILYCVLFAIFALGTGFCAALVLRWLRRRAS